jgi:D-alanyl-D-alanine carboxypeptidase/D-alanyl-D-alanine-endopeptidase (penicillin-binding protein 4)
VRPADVDAAAIERATSRFAAEVSKLGARGSAAVWSLPDRSPIAFADDMRPVNPASNAKLATAITALSRLGPEHRFVTGLYGEQRGEEVASLVLKGRGDPELRTADLVGLARQLHVRGVRRVGRIVVDQSHFTGSHVPPAFDQQPDEWASFRAPIAATSVDRNTLTIWVRPGAEGSPATTVVEPPGYVDVEGSVATRARDTEERIGLELAARGDRVVAKLSGSVPVGPRPVALVRRVDDPSLVAGFALASVLRERGIDVSGGVERGSPPTGTALATHRSRPLAELVHALGKDSDNFAAEMIFATLGGLPRGTKQASAGGAEVVRAELEARSAFMPGTTVVNGSGLFDANRATARGLVALLASAAADPRIAHETVTHLAVAGADGTLRGRLESLRSGRRLRAKTGTLAASVALSGYVLGSDARPRLAFALLVDDARGKTAEARLAIDRAAASYASAVR